MNIYIILFISILLYGLLFLKLFNKKETFLFVSFLSMSLVLGFRDVSVGEDTLHFMDIFNSCPYIEWKTILSSTDTVWANVYGVELSVESGYLLINKIIYCFTHNFQWVLIIISALTCFNIANFIYQNSRNVFISTYIFLCESLYMQSFNLMRQMLALSIGINSYTCLKKREYKKALLLLLISFLIHKSSIILLLLIPICMVNNYKRAIKYILFGSVITAGIFPIIIELVSNFIPRYASYFGTNYWQTSIGGTVILWILQIIVCIYMYTKGIKDKNTFIAIVCTAIYLSMEIVGIKISAFSRISLYFRSFVILLLPEFFRYLSKRFRRIWCIVFLVILAIAFFRYAGIESRIYSFFF